MVASKIREALRQPFTLQGHQITVTASIGISIYPSDSMDADTLIKNGDAAMYRSKQVAGRDTYRFFTAEMNARAIEKLDKENALREALDRNEFVLHYQPKVAALNGPDHGGGSTDKMEASGNGFVAPAEFIPILEQTGLINRVGAWVIDSACRQIAEWRRAGARGRFLCLSMCPAGNSCRARSTRTSFGRRRRTMSHPELLEFELQTERALRENSIDSDLLELELTESSLMTHARKTTEVFSRD